MKLTTKKIIAREFLYFSSICFIGLICFMLIYPYNSYLEKKIRELNIQITNKGFEADSLLKVYKSKIQNQEWYFKVMSAEFDLKEYDTWQKWWVHTSDLAKGDYFNSTLEVLFTKDDFYPSIGFSTADSLKRFVISNTLNNEDIESLTKSENLQTKIGELNNDKNELESDILSHNQQVDFTGKVILISVLLLFGVRYLIHGIKWSLQTLSQK